jgi:cytoplasmic polyadenylation element-binding protein
MEFEYEQRNNNNIGIKLYSTSPTSSSTSSSGSVSTHSTSSTAVLPISDLLSESTDKMASPPAQKNVVKTTNSQFATMSSSTSQIFATAATFNICQNDTVFYSRETVHLFAKFLSEKSTDPIFRSLYAFAPDNLAWLWSFIDWDSLLDLSTLVPTQDQYIPFQPIENLDVGSAELHEVNKLFLDAFLIQYKYREPIMIGDVFKFLEHVSKTEHDVVAKALFLLYFPRFTAYIDNPLKDVITVKVLKTNLNVIKKLDDIIVSLIKSRYTNIAEYKEKIENRICLPSYIRSLLKDGADSFPSENTPNKLNDLKSNLEIKFLAEKNDTEYNKNNPPVLYSPFSVETRTDVKQKFGYENKEVAEVMMGNLDLNKNVFVPKNNAQSSTASAFFPASNTLDYMKLLEERNQINDDLDHVSFDQQKKAAMFCNTMNQIQENLDVFYDNNSNNNNQRNNLNNGQQYQLNNGGTTNFDENNNNYNQVNAYDRINPNETMQQCYDAINDSDIQSNVANLNLATLTLPKLSQNISSQLNNLTLDSCFKNSGNRTPSSSGQSAGLDSPRQEFRQDFKYQSNSAKQGFNYPKQPSVGGNSCMSPPSSKYNSKGPLFHTPKTPSNFDQYQEKSQNDFISVWQNPPNLTLPNNNRFYNANSVTPPPSATFKTSPLSVITNNGMLDTGPIGSKMNSPNYSNNENLLSPNSVGGVFMGNTKNHLDRFNESILSQINNNPSSIMHDELNAYLKHQFYGSPVTNRGNRFNDYRTNANKLLQKNDFNMDSNIYPNLKTRFNSNNDLNTGNANAFYNHHQRNNNDLIFDDLNSSKSPSSTSSGGPLQTQTHYTNPNHRVNQSNLAQHQHTWSGRLPPKIYTENAIYSRKVFLGGLPWDVNQNYLLQLLQKYGQVKIEVPGKDQKHPRVSNINKSQERSTPGYVYVIYEHESAVQRMLADCRKEHKNGGEHYFYTIFIPSNQNTNCNNSYYYNNNITKRGKAKEVEVIPWNQEDTSYVPQNKTSMLPAKIDAKTTIFVGALHGMLNAIGLAKVMNEVFGEVIHAGLDTDKYKYPIGSGRVTFRHRQSYVKAIKSKFVTIKANQEPIDPSPKFEKTIQIDPYLEDAKCSKCANRSYFFCRNENCLDYYCENCWKTNHDMIGNDDHQSLSRQNKPEQLNRQFK